MLYRIQPFGLRIRSHDHSLVRFVLTLVTSFYSTFGLFYFITLCRFYFSLSLFISTGGWNRTSIGGFRIRCFAIKRPRYQPVDQ